MGPTPFAHDTQLLGTTTLYLNVGLQVSRLRKLTGCVVIDVRPRAERRKDRICSDFQYQKMFERLRQLPHTVEHLIVQLGTLIWNVLVVVMINQRLWTGVPIVYPRIVFLESALDLVHLGKSGIFGLSGMVNNLVSRAR